MRFCVWGVLAAAIAVSGCDLDPEYQAPKVALPSHFDDAPGAAQSASPGGQWWREFRDAQLTEFEDKVDEANPDLAAALAHAQAALARAQAAAATQYPELDAGGQVTANKQSDDRPLRSANQPTYYGDNRLSAIVPAYEIDIWGRVADIVKAARAEADVSADAFSDAKIELHAELARDYVDLRGLDAEANLLARTIDIYRSALDLTHSRVAASISPPMDEERAKTQLATAQASASDLALRRAALVNAIATLTGVAAPGFHIAPSMSEIPLPRRPGATPGAVLLRRPDVAAGERETEAVSARIGVARAAFYPRFTIGLLGGTEDTGFNLLSLTNSTYALGPAVSVPIFDFGLREAELKEAQTRFKAAAESYRSTVLKALQDVQDSLSALHWLADEARHAQVAAEAARKTADMSMALYKNGASSYLDVVTAQNASLDADRSVIALRALQLRAEVALMLALGGGWTPDNSDRTQILTADDAGLNH